MRGVGIVFSRFLEVDIDLGVLIGMGIVFFYAVLGGMKGITLHSGRPVLCADFRLLGACYLYLLNVDRRALTDVGFRFDNERWIRDLSPG